MLQAQGHVCSFQSHVDLHLLMYAKVVDSCMLSIHDHFGLPMPPKRSKLSSSRINAILSRQQLQAIK